VLKVALLLGGILHSASSDSGISLYYKKIAAYFCSVGRQYTKIILLEVLNGTTFVTKYRTFWEFKLNSQNLFLQKKTLYLGMERVISTTILVLFYAVIAILEA